MVCDLKSQGMKCIMHFPVIRQTKFPVKIRRNKCGGSGTATRFNQIKLGSFHRFYKFKFLIEKDFHQLMNPFRFGHSPDNQIIKINQTCSMLPVASLLAPYESSYNSACSNLI